MIYCFDLDGTLCETVGNDYPHSIPIQKAVDKVNRLYLEGHTIKIFTARGSLSGKQWGEFTREQLNKWGLHFNELIIGKPHGDIYIDDKAMNAKDWLETI